MKEFTITEQNDIIAYARNEAVAALPQFGGNRQVRGLTFQVRFVPTGRPTVIRATILVTAHYGQCGDYSTGPVNPDQPNIMAPR